MSKSVINWQNIAWKMRKILHFDSRLLRKKPFNPTKWHWRLKWTRPLLFQRTHWYLIKDSPFPAWCMLISAHIAARISRLSPLPPTSIPNKMTTGWCRHRRYHGNQLFVNSSVGVRVKHTLLATSVPDEGRKGQGGRMIANREFQLVYGHNYLLTWTVALYLSISDINPCRQSYSPPPSRLLFSVSFSVSKDRSG